MDQPSSPSIVPDFELASTPRSILPEVGAFVAFRIDPIASLSETAQQIPEVIEACNTLVCKQYVGFVAERDGLYMPWDPYNSCVVRLLRQGDPEDTPHDFTSSSMSVPILPMNKETHISGGPPLLCSKMLPWHDCYISASADAMVRSPSQWTTDHVEWTLNRAEQTRLRNYMIDDHAERQTRDRSRDPESSCPCPAKPETENNNPDDGSFHPDVAVGEALEVARPSSPVSQQSAAPSDCSADYSDISENEEWETREELDFKDDQGATDLMDLLFESTPSTEAMITVHFTHDLSTVAVINDPADYYSEVAVIQKIEKEAASRIEAYKVQKLQNDIKRAQEIDAAVYDDETNGMLIAHDSPPSSTQLRSSESLDHTQEVCELTPAMDSTLEEKITRSGEQLPPTARETSSSASPAALFSACREEMAPSSEPEGISVHESMVGTLKSRVVDRHPPSESKRRGIIFRVASN
ncbi:hypothetical protein R3P38DRAFT_3429682 [Favolaschia claudopus]|uniref:Uncharacterized protein n=1 Tax=Favolaschia claudopus TaxID=2862362 RepID=A0AAV9ZV28_9AGAR